MTTRLLMVGLDGADGRLLDRCSADGSLPHLAALRARGRAHRLTAEPGATDDALWASFQYAAEVGEHGRYFFSLPFGDGQLGKAYWAEVGRPAFWDDLSDQGQRVAIIDVPKCRNPQPLNGIHLADWLVHGNFFAKPRGQPHSLVGDVVRRFGSQPRCRCNYQMPILNDADVGEIISDLCDTVSTKRAVGLHYLASEPWDLFVIGFKEAHCVGHGLWDFDPGHPAYDPERMARLGDPLMTVFREIDKAVGDLVAAAGPAAEVVVFSTTDFQANGSLEHLMPSIAERLNAHFSRGGEASADWRCSVLPYGDGCAALRLSRAGQAPIVDAPPDPRQMEAIEAQLWDLRDAATGEPVVSTIARPSSDLKGPRAASLPDLLVLSPAGSIPNAVMSTTLGRIEIASPPRRQGNHAEGGFLIAAGAVASAEIDGVQTMAGFGALAKAVLGPPQTLAASGSTKPTDAGQWVR